MNQQFNVSSTEWLQSRWRVILASGSPRRKQILSSLGIPFEVVPSKFPEDLDKSQFKSPHDYVSRNALEKANEVYERMKDKSAFVISADTIVVVDNQILEKPRDKMHALEMLQNLSGRSHIVLTGVCLLFQRDNVLMREEFLEETTVHFATLPLEWMHSYVDSGEPMDKAGGYGYQGLAAFLVKGISGCYYNVVGFPAHQFLSKITSIHQSFSE